MVKKIERGSTSIENCNGQEFGCVNKLSLQQTTLLDLTSIDGIKVDKDLNVSKIADLEMDKAFAVDIQMKLKWTRTWLCHIAGFEMDGCQRFFI